MKTKSVNRALVVETRNREVAGGSLWAGRLLRQALFLFRGGVIMEEKDQRTNEVCEILKEACRKLDEKFNQGEEKEEKVPKPGTHNKYRLRGG